MKNKKTLIALSIAALTIVISSCKVQDQTYHEVYGYDDKALSNAENIQYSDIKITELNCGLKNFLISPQKISISEDGIFALDNNNIYHFNKDGEFINKIGEQGHGKGEYISLATFCLDSNKMIALLDSYTGKIIKYTTDGIFKGETKTGELISNIQEAEYIDENSIFACDYIFNNNKKIFRILNPKEKDFSTIANTNISSNNTKEAIGRHPFSIHNGVISYIMPFDNCIYQVNDSITYQYNTQKELFPIEKQKNIEDFSIMTYQKLLTENIFTGFTDIYETDKYILTMFKNIEYAIIDKNELRCNRYKYNLEKDTNYFPIYNIVASYENTLYGLINTSDLNKIKTYDIDNVHINRLMKYKNSEEKFLLISYSIK